MGRIEPEGLMCSRGACGHAMWSLCACHVESLLFHEECVCAISCGVRASFTWSPSYITWSVCSVLFHAESVQFEVESVLISRQGPYNCHPNSLTPALKLPSNPNSFIPALDQPPKYSFSSLKTATQIVSSQP